MTDISYTHELYDLKNGQHRLFGPMDEIIITVACVAVAFESQKRPSASIMPGDTCALGCSKFNKRIILPLYGPIQHAVNNERPERIVFQIISPAEIAPEPGDSAKGFNEILIKLVGMQLAFLFDSYRSKIIERHGKNPAKWPSLFSFVRIIRNAIAHDGRLSKRELATNAVTWHHLTYSGADGGKRVFESDLRAADIILLMMDFNGELDRLGYSQRASDD